MIDLINMSCKNSLNVEKLESNEIMQYIDTQIPQWQFDINKNIIYRKFEFKNFKQTMFFVNAVAYICEKEIHHPDMKIGFNYCDVNFQTHDVQGVSLNDIICATKIDILV